MKTRSENFLTADNLKWEELGEGIRRQIMGYDGHLMMVKVEFKLGAIGYEHAHYHSQSTFVVSGKFKVKIGDKEVILQAGDGFYTEPDINHGAVCLEEGMLIDTFSPVRADFLKK